MLPLVGPYILSGYAFAFVLSLNEYIVAYMVAGFTIETLPIKIFNSLRYGYTPTMAAVTVVFVAFAALVFGLIARFGDLPRLLGAWASEGQLMRLAAFQMVAQAGDVAANLAMIEAAAAEAKAKGAELLVAPELATTGYGSQRRDPRPRRAGRWRAGRCARGHGREAWDRARSRISRSGRATRSTIPRSSSMPDGAAHDLPQMPALRPL